MWADEFKEATTAVAAVKAGPRDVRTSALLEAKEQDSGNHRVEASSGWVVEEPWHH